MDAMEMPPQKICPVWNHLDLLPLCTDDASDDDNISIIVQNGSRIVSCREDPVPRDGDHQPCCLSPSSDLTVLKKVNGFKLFQEQSVAECRPVSLKRKRPPRNGLKPLVWNGNESYAPNRGLERLDESSLPSVDQPPRSEVTSQHKSRQTILSPPVQRIFLSCAPEPPITLDEVPSDEDVTTGGGVSCNIYVPRPRHGPSHYSFDVTPGLQAEASANYRSARKRKLDSITPDLTKSHGSPKELKLTGASGGINDDSQADALNVTSNQISPTAPKLNCRLPFNGHREDTQHYRSCEFVLAGMLMRDEHTKWLRDLPSLSEIDDIVNLIIGSSCKQIILNSKCNQEHCTSEHAVNLYFNIPPEQVILFTKWFLKNAVLPSFRVILFVLSHLPKDLHDTLMIVFSYAQMLIKLHSRLYKRALGGKLIKIMVDVLKYTPWEASRALLIFGVTPETQLSDVLDLLGSLEVTNRFYESLSCLWHVSECFVCPPDLLFKTVKECVVEMPVDLKLTKDRILTNLVKTPRSLLRKEFLFIEKFLSKYYPQNSVVAQCFRTFVFYGVAITKSLGDCGTYETCRVKGTGPVNPQWHYWDVQEARTKAFNLVISKRHKDRSEDVNLRLEPFSGRLKENIDVCIGKDGLFEFIESNSRLSRDGNRSCANFEEKDDAECLIESLVSGKYGQVVKIMLTCWKSYNTNSFELCLVRLQKELELCDKDVVSLVVFEILQRLPGSRPDETAVRSGFVRSVNSLVVKLHKNMDYKTAVKLLKAMRVAGVNHLDHPPKGTNRQTFTVICSDLNFQCRLFPDAVRTLMYKKCLRFHENVLNGSFPDHFYLLEKLVMDMCRRFLRERHASHALEVFRLAFGAQRNLHFPLNIAKYYEGVIFLSFVSDLKKNACSAGAGANLYITVDRTCGNYVPFHSITYRSLLVELIRADAPEDIVRRTLRICLKKKIYPDFSRGPISPLVLDSHLTREEMSIYLKHYFTHCSVQNDAHPVTDRPFVVRFSETPPPDKKLFPVSNDVMKTSRCIEDAFERLKSALDGLSSELNIALDTIFSQDSVTVPAERLEMLLDLFRK